MGQWEDYQEPDIQVAKYRPPQWYEYNNIYLLPKLNILQFYGSCYKVMYRKKMAEISQEERESAKFYISLAISFFKDESGLVDFNIFKPTSVTVPQLMTIFELFALHSFEKRKEIYLEQKLNSSVNYILKYRDMKEEEVKQAQKEDNLGYF